MKEGNIGPSCSGKCAHMILVKPKVCQAEPRRNELRQSKSGYRQQGRSPAGPLNPMIVELHVVNKASRVSQAVIASSVEEARSTYC
jgi:hypothetical protein